MTRVGLLPAVAWLTTTILSRGSSSLRSARMLAVTPIGNPITTIGIGADRMWTLGRSGGAERGGWGWQSWNRSTPRRPTVRRVRW